jgi:hypothetical protein
MSLFDEVLINIDVFIELLNKYDIRRFEYL